MPYIGNVLTSFAVETGNINDQAVTAPKLSATGGTDGQVLALDSNLNLEWVSDPAGQWVTSGSNIYYNDGNVGIGITSPSDLLEITPTSTREGLTIKTTGTTFGGINIDTNRTGAGHTLGDIRFMWDGTGVAGITGHTGSDTTNKDDGRLIFNTASAGSATERMRIDSSGNVGIGDTSPTKPLTVGTSTPVVLLDDQSSRTLELRGPSSTHVAGLLTTSNHSLLLGTNNTERLRIDSSGRLLVGTTSGNDTGSESNLVIESNSSGGTSYGGLMLRRGSTSISSGTSLGRLYFADQNGNTGARISALGDGTWATDDYPGVLIFDTTADGGSSPTERMRIDSSGNVGIGHTSPASLLTVGGDAITTTKPTVAIAPDSGNGSLTIRRGSPTLFFDVTAGGDGTIIYDSSSDLLFKKGTLDSSSEVARINEDGSLLIGSSVAATAGDAQYAYLQIAGNTAGVSGSVLALKRGEAASAMSDDDSLGTIIFTGTTGGDFATIRGSVDGSPSGSDFPGRIVFSTTADGANSPTERMRIDSSGDVGIGEDSIEAPLHIGKADSWIDIGAQSGNRAKFGFDSNKTYIANSSSVGEIVFKKNNTRAGNPWSSGTELARLISGGGITFNGDTAAANALNDYEEGESNTSVTAITASTNSVAMKYTKVGNLVTVVGVITLAGITASSSTNGTFNLPFTPSAYATSVPGCDIQKNDIDSGTKYLGTYGANPNLYFNAEGGGYRSTNNLTAGQIGFTISYTTW